MNQHIKAKLPGLIILGIAIACLVAFATLKQTILLPVGSVLLGVGIQVLLRART